MLQRRASRAPREGGASGEDESGLASCRSSSGENVMAIARRDAKADAGAITGRASSFFRGACKMMPR